jgi:ketosteroid isomerase-like protein
VGGFEAEEISMRRFLTYVLLMVGSAALLGQSADHPVLVLERRGMDGWLRGNPDAILAIADPAITYFHSTMETKLDGLAAVKAVFEGYRGRPLFDRYDIVDPKVVTAGDVAVLTYQLVTQNGTLTRRWHATEVFREHQASWRLIHGHFSLVQQ